MNQIHQTMKGKAIFRLLGDEGAGFFEEEVDEASLTVGLNDVILQVHACSIDAHDQQLVCELFLKKPKVRVSAASCMSGVIRRVGPAVTLLQIGDRVAGVLPLDSESSGCANFCVISEFNIIRLPQEVSMVAAVQSLGEGVKAYTALHYLGGVERGESVLIMDAGWGFGFLAVQLALSWGATVFAVITSDQERSRLQMLHPSPDHIVEMDAGMAALASTIHEETGRLGVDVIIDNGVRLFTNASDTKMAAKDTVSRSLPSKQSIISCLAVGGRWVTSHPLLQLDPPNSLQLFLRGASVSFLFDQSWGLSSARQGKWMHIARDVISRLSQRSLAPPPSIVLPLHLALDTLNAPRSSGDSPGGAIVIDMVATATSGQ